MKTPLSSLAVGNAGNSLEEGGVGQSVSIAFNEIGVFKTTPNFCSNISWELTTPQDNGVAFLNNNWTSYSVQHIFVEYLLCLKHWVWLFSA